MSPRLRRLRRVVLAGTIVLTVAFLGIGVWAYSEPDEPRISLQFDGTAASEESPQGKFNVVNQGETSVCLYLLEVDSLDPSKTRNFLSARGLPQRALRPGQTNSFVIEIPPVGRRGIAEVTFFRLTPRRELWLFLKYRMDGRPRPGNRQFLFQGLEENKIDGQRTSIEFHAAPASTNAP